MSKIKRKTNISKRRDRGCRNHGSCPYCRNSRLHNAKKRIAEAELEIRQHGQVLTVELPYWKPAWEVVISDAGIM